MKKYIKPEGKERMDFTEERFLETVKECSEQYGVNRNVRIMFVQKTEGILTVRAETGVIVPSIKDRRTKIDIAEGSMKEKEELKEFAFGLRDFLRKNYKLGRVTTLMKVTE